MTVSFPDQVAAFLAVAANQGPFPGQIGLAPFATTSFGKRYGQNGYQISNVTVGALSDLLLQELLLDQGRVSGFREKRSEQPQRFWYELKVTRADLAWADVSFSVPVQLTVQVSPGSIELGPAGGLAQAGVSDPSPLTHQLNFQIPVLTDSFSLAYTASVFVFATADPSPVADLRRILALRRVLENDPLFLSALDGPPDQRPYLFVQLYPTATLTGPPLSQAAVTQTFAAADILAVFMTIAAM
jgi:hypothetical protein